MTSILAWAYAALAALPFALQIALALGAPWARYSLGGRFDGALPGTWRPLALVQAGVLVLMALAVLTRGGALDLGWPSWTFWLTLALTGLTTLANAASRSPQERALWTPVAALMLALALVIAWRTAGA